MKISKGEIISLVAVLISVIIGFIVYPLLPEKVASHWNSAGEVNGYMSRFWGAFLMPIISAVMYFIFLIVPRVDPKRENIEKFRRDFDNFIILLFLFMLYIYGLTLWWNMGGRFEMVRYLMPAMAVLFYCIGIMVGRAKMNFSIGIRTPWTLSSEEVWRKTHLLGGKLFKACGVLVLIGAIFPYYAVWFVLVPSIAAAAWSMIYSYTEFRKEQKKRI